MGKPAIFSGDLPTPYPAVNALLQTLLKEVEMVLGEHLIGMYLFGSLATGDFDQDSDVDVAVISDVDIGDAVFIELRRMHERITQINSPWANQLEVSYLSLKQLFRYDPVNARHPQLQRDKGSLLEMDNHARVVERHVLRERGIVVAGPALQSLIAPVSADDLTKSAVEIVNEWLTPMLGREVPFESRGYQSYTVLSLCRILYTLEHGKIASKPTAARWAQEKFGEKWTHLIQSAIRGRQSPQLPPEPQDVAETLQFMRFTLEKTRELASRFWQNDDM